MSTVSSPIQQYAQFDPSKHPRGQPENAGEFAPKGGGSTQPSDKPDDSGGESPDVSQSSGAPAPQQIQPEQIPQPVQPEEASQEVVHVSSMDVMPDEAKNGFEEHVLSPLRTQVSELDKIATNPQLGKRYAWESATHRGEKPGDPHAGSAGLARWKAHATRAGYHADEAIANHSELNDLTARLDKHRGWGTEPSGKPVQKPTPRQGDEVQRVSNDEVMQSPHWDEWLAGLGPERTMAQAASGMQGIHGREYAIRQHSPDKWQIISRKKQDAPTSQPEQQPPESPVAEVAPQPEPQPPAPPADDTDDLDDEGHASNWNAVIEDHGKATPQQLKHAMRAVDHMRQHHAANPNLTPDQRTAITSLLDSHHAKITQALSAHDQPKTESETPTADESSSAPPEPKAGASVAERHHAVGQKIDLAPAPVKDLLRSLHNLRDTKRNGHVQTKELGADYAKEMYDHLKSNKRSGDGFGDVHDMSSELGHGAMGYSSPAGNLAIIPPKFKNDDFDVRYTLPHESQQESEPVADKPAEQPPPAAEPEATEATDATTSFPWEQDNPETELKDGKPLEHWDALEKLKQNRFNDKRNPIGKKIIEMVGDDPIEQHGMHQAVLQTHKDLNRQIAERNHAYTSLLGQFLGEDPRARTKFINAAKAIEKQGGDYSEIPHFDEMVTMVQNSPHEYGSLLQRGTFNRTDVAQQLMDRFIRDEGGLEKELPLASDDVLSEAAARLHGGLIEFADDDPYYIDQLKSSQQEHTRRLQSDPHYRAIWEQQEKDLESTPFSRAGQKLRYEKIRRWLASSYRRWRKYSRQLGFAWGAEEEALHPRAPGGQWTDKEGHAPGAPAPHAAKPATAPDEMPDMPLFSQPPPVSQPPQQAVPQPAPSQPVQTSEPPAATAEPSQESEPPVPTAEQQDEKLTKALTEQESTNQFMVAKYQETKDPTILDQLLEDNQRLLIRAARKWAKNPTEFDDYMQEANNGFISAVNQFDPSKKMSFAGYASLHISNGLHKQHRFFTRGERSKDEGKRVKTISASQLPPDDDVPSSMEQLAMATGRRPSRPMEHLELQAELKKTFQDEFSDRDADVIQMRFGVGRYENNPHEYPEIARKLGMTTEGARMIVKRAEPALKRRLKDHYDPEDYAKSASESKDVTEQDWRDATEKYGLSWDRCFQRGEPERYGMLDGQDAHVIAQALAEWYWNLPDRRDREKADHYAKQLGFSFGDEPPAPAPAAKPATAPSGGGWGGSQEELHPRATEQVTIAGKTYSGGQWIPKDQAAQATPMEQAKIELVSKSGQQKNPATDIHAAFAKIEAGDRKSSIGTGALTMVSMEDLRSQLPQYSKEELDREIRKLREADYYTMETGHGRTTPEMRAAGIQEGSDNLIWIARRR